MTATTMTTPRTKAASPISAGAAEAKAGEEKRNEKENRQLGFEEVKKDGKGGDEEGDEGKKEKWEGEEKKWMKPVAPKTVGQDAPQPKDKEAFKDTPSNYRGIESR